MGCVHVNKFSYTKPQVWAVYCWHFSLPSVFSCAWIGQELGRSSSSSSPPRHVAQPPPGPAHWPAPPAASAPGSPGSAAQPLRPGCPPWLGEQHRTVGLPICLPSQPYTASVACASITVLWNSCIAVMHVHSHHHLWYTPISFLMPSRLNYMEQHPYSQADTPHVIAAVWAAKNMLAVWNGPQHELLHTTCLMDILGCLVSVEDKHL